MGFVIALLAKNLMNGLPINKTITNDVNTAKPVLKVIYLKTFKKKINQQSLKENYKALIFPF